MAKDISPPGPDDTASAPSAPGAAAGADGADANTDVPQMSYEAARDELVDIVARLENGQVGLEDSMGLWQRGEALAAHCAQWLDDAEARLSD
ncbi:exodeoxyribonuclease VII small subunit [Knoellia sp. CPCC 206435]|uniref:exodeoxyribonuclease VII small subunit n=1 Tax=Knoellia terrae TaxID=3404797 RepID=UPI003B4344D0